MNRLKKYSMRGLWVLLCVLALYGAGRLYFRLTDGFLETNIIYDVPHELRRTTEPLSQINRSELESVLLQDFFYLGKGCQSYVFSSEDGKYVLKFFKYQRFRPQAWLDYFAFIPGVDAYRLRKIEKKKRKLKYAFSSWRLAYEELQPETGVVYVHLDKSHIWHRNLVFYDKLGLRHEIDLNEVEFMVQKRARMLCSEILHFKQNQDLQGGQELIDRLLALLVSEYERGFADNDHALMQNTGVYESNPIHIDVGQFVKNPEAANPNVYKQELFSKMWKFRMWLRKHYAELGDYTDQKLASIIGPSFESMQPQLNKSSMGRIPAKINE